MMMHLSQADMQDFLGHTMHGERLLEVDEHLAACGACRAALQSLRTGMGIALEPHGGHLDFETIRALADGHAVSEGEARHAANCGLCAAEIADLKQFAASLAGTSRTAAPTRLALVPRRSSLVLRPAFYSALAACLALAATVAYFRHAQPAAPTIALNDGAVTLSLDGNGKLHGAESLPVEDRTLLAAALQTGRIQTAPIAASRTETILGTKGPSARFNVIAPVASSMLTTRPTFTWEPLPSATSYVVSIYESGYRKVMQGEAVTTTSWQPAAALQPGAAYTWTVTAHIPGGVVREPAPPEAEAAFTIVSADQLAAVQQEIGRHAQDPLFLAMFYARAGDIAEARRQMEVVVAQNPGSSLAKSLRASLDQTPSPVKRNAAQ